MNLPDSDMRHPPGPEQPQVLGIDANTLTLLQDLQSQYGNFVGLQKEKGRQAIFINDAAEVRQLLVKHHSKYRKGPGFERVKMLLGNGLIVSDGDIWRRSRTMIQPAFSRQNVHRLISLMVDCTQKRATAWEEVARAGGELNITQEMSDFGLELILRTVFGPDYERRVMQNGKNPFAFLSRDSKRDLSVVMQLRELRELLLSIIAERRASDSVEHFDFLTIYLSATDKSGNGFTDAELLDELMTLIVAGYETSAGTLNWAWYLIARNANAEEKLLQEARQQLPEPTLIDKESLTDMVYGQALLEETLRLYPPVWLFTRRAEQDDVFTEFDVNAGADIYLSPFILHRTKEYWPDPDRFDPDRFGPDSEYRKGDRPYFPFSLGPRRCLGEYFSFLEMKVHLGLLIQKFHMTLATNVEPELELGINLRTQDDIFLLPNLREQH